MIRNGTRTRFLRQAVREKQERQCRQLREQWASRFPNTVSTLLEAMLTDYGLQAARQATDALEALEKHLHQEEEADS